MEAGHQNAARQHAREAAAVKFRDPDRRAHVGLVAVQGKRLHLAIRQPLLFRERFRRARVPMLDSLIKRSHPQVHLGSGECPHIQMAERGM